MGIASENKKYVPWLDVRCRLPRQTTTIGPNGRLLRQLMLYLFDREKASQDVQTFGNLCNIAKVARASFATADIECKLHRCVQRLCPSIVRSCPVSS